MSTHSAMIVVSASNDFGNTDIIGNLVLREGDRPVWSMKFMNSKNKIPNIIPSLENMLEDALFVLYYYIFEEKNTLSLAPYKFKVKLDEAKRAINMYKDIEKDARQRLYKVMKKGKIPKQYSILVIPDIWDNRSTIVKQLGVLKEFKLNYKVLKPVKGK